MRYLSLAWMVSSFTSLSSFVCINHLLENNGMETEEDTGKGGQMQGKHLCIMSLFNTYIPIKPPDDLMDGTTTGKESGHNAESDALQQDVEMENSNEVQGKLFIVWSLSFLSCPQLTRFGHGCYNDRERAQSTWGEQCNGTWNGTGQGQRNAR